MMGSWRSKILFTLIIYGAGFVTAVYFLAPCPVQASDQTQQGETIVRSHGAQTVTDNASINSQEWVTTVRTGIDTCIRFAEEYALRAADLIRSQMGQGNDQSD
ncbi:MAG: hypothetical protein ACYSU8_04785 [Planctomycetota bacterium]